jgi:hypothetical protein
MALARCKFGGSLLLLYNGDANLKAMAWDSSKGRISRIKAPLYCTAARIAVCHATIDQGYQLPSVLAGRREGRLHLRSRCGLKKSAMPSR